MAVTHLLDQRKEIVRRLHEDLLSNGKLDLLGEIIADDYVGADGRVGISPFLETIRDLRVGFPDILWTVDDLVAEGDLVAVRWTWEGTHTGTMRLFPSTGKRVTNAGYAIYQFRDDKIVRVWMLTDRLGFVQQIGVVPSDLRLLRQSQPAKALENKVA